MAVRSYLEKEVGIARTDDYCKREINAEEEIDLVYEILEDEMVHASDL